jgi:hypothetical protein
MSKRRSPDLVRQALDWAVELNSRAVPAERAVDAREWQKATNLLVALHCKLHLAQVSCANLLYPGTSGRVHLSGALQRFLQTRHLEPSQVLVFDSRLFLNVRRRKSLEQFTFAHVPTCVLLDATTLELLAVAHDTPSCLTLVPQLQTTDRDDVACVEEAYLEQVQLLHQPRQDEETLPSLKSLLRSQLRCLNHVLRNAAIVHHIYTHESARVLVGLAAEVALATLDSTNPLRGPILQLATTASGTRRTHQVNCPSSFVPCCYLARTPVGATVTPAAVAAKQPSHQGDPSLSVAAATVDVALSVAPTHGQGDYATTGEDAMLPGAKQQLASPSTALGSHDPSEGELPRQKRILERFVTSSSSTLLSLSKRLNGRGFTLEQLQHNPFVQVALDTKGLIGDVVKDHMRQLNLSTQEAIDLEQWSEETCRRVQLQFGPQTRFGCLQLLTDLLFLMVSSDAGPWFLPFDRELPNREALATVLRTWNVGRLPSDCACDGATPSGAQLQPSHEPHGLLSSVAQRVNTFLSQHEHLCIQRMHVSSLPSATPGTTAAAAR